MDWSQSAPQGTAPDPRREDHVDGVQWQQEAKLALCSSGGVARKGELKLETILLSNLIPGQTAGRKIAPGWQSFG